MATVIPSGNDERVIWTLNFDDNFPVLAPDLGFNAAEITSLVNDSAMLRFAILNAQTAAAFSKTCTAFKNAMIGGVGENVEQPKVPVYNPLVPPTAVDAGVLERLSKAIQRAKLSANFNKSVAEQLMIATTAPDTNIPDDSKPTASGTAMTGSVVRIDWTKRQFDGVYVDSQRNEKTAWTRLDFDMRRPTKTRARQRRQANPRRAAIG